MHAQENLFGIPSDTSPQSVFPEFKIESSTKGYLDERPGPIQARKILEQLGFTVGGIRTHEGQILIFPVGEVLEEVTLFEVSYPPGWTLTEDLSHEVYTGDCNGVRQILDDNMNLRGIAHCGSDGIPLSVTLYTRYAVLEGVSLNFSQLPFKRDAELRSVVIDYTKIDRMKPHVIPEVEHIDRRWLLAEKYPILRERPAGLSLLESYSWIQRHVGVCGGMEFIGMSGSSLWLDEHYPHWKDPIAYWP